MKSTPQQIDYSIHASNYGVFPLIWELFCFFFFALFSPSSFAMPFRRQSFRSITKFIANWFMGMNMFVVFVFRIAVSRHPANLQNKFVWCSASYAYLYYCVSYTWRRKFLWLRARQSRRWHWNARRRTVFRLQCFAAENAHMHLRNKST